MLDKIVRETRQRASLVPQPGCTPSILVSEPSVGDFDDPFFLGNPRRSSTQSMGPVVVPVSIIRDVIIEGFIRAVCKI